MLRHGSHTPDQSFHCFEPTSPRSAKARRLFFPVEPVSPSLLEQALDLSFSHARVCAASPESAPVISPRQPTTCQSARKRLLSSFKSISSLSFRYKRDGPPLPLPPTPSFSIDMGNTSSSLQHAQPPQFLDVSQSSHGSWTGHGGTRPSVELLASPIRAEAADDLASPQPAPLSPTGGLPQRRQTSSLGRGLVRKLSFRAGASVARIKKSSTPYTNSDNARASTAPVRPPKSGKRSIVDDLDAFEALVEAAEARSGTLSRSQTRMSAAPPSLAEEAGPQTPVPVVARPPYVRHLSSPSGNSSRSPSIKSARRAEREWRAKVAALSASTDGKRMSPKSAATSGPAARARGPVPPPRRPTTASNAHVATPPAQVRSAVDSPGETLILTPAASDPVLDHPIPIKSPSPLSIKSFSTLGHHVGRSSLLLSAPAAAESLCRTVRDRKASVPRSVSTYYASGAMADRSRPSSLAAIGLLAISGDCESDNSEDQGTPDAGQWVDEEAPGEYVDGTTEKRAMSADETHSTPTASFRSARTSSSLPATPRGASMRPTPDQTPAPVPSHPDDTAQTAAQMAVTGATLTDRPPQTPVRATSEISPSTRCSPTTAQILAADFLDFSFDNLEFALFPAPSTPAKNPSAHPYAACRTPTVHTVAPSPIGPSPPPKPPKSLLRLSPPPSAPLPQRPDAVPAPARQQSMPPVTERKHLPKRSTSLRRMADQSFLPLGAAGPADSKARSQRRPGFRQVNNDSRLQILGTDSAGAQRQATDARQAGPPKPAVILDRTLIFSSLEDDLTPGTQTGQRPPKSGMPISVSAKSEVGGQMLIRQELEKWLRGTSISQ